MNGKRLDGGAAAAIAHQLGQHFTNGRADLETGARKPKAMDQAGGGLAQAQHRLAIGQITFCATPGADEVGMAQGGQQLDSLQRQSSDGAALGPGAVMRRVGDPVVVSATTRRAGPSRLTSIVR